MVHRAVFTYVHTYIHTYTYIYIYIHIHNTYIHTYIHREATGWTVRGSNLGGGEIFRTRSDRPWGPLSPLYNG